MSTDGISQDHLNGQSAVILVVFVVVSFFVIWPVQVPLLGFVQRNLLRVLRLTRIIDPRTSDALSRRRLHFPLSLETAPVIGVLLLLATTTIDGSTIRLGVKGDDDVKPYDVLVLFISLAYIAIALDGTGALEAVAFWVSQRGGSSGPRLFAYLYAFFLLTGCIVGNDPLILSGTPFLAYLTKHAKLDPTPWIFSEFMAANTASAVLVSSNPTNILITGSFDLNFLTGFTKWTILPSIVPGIINYFILWFMFRHQIPETLVPLKDDPWTKLRDPRGALFLSVLMLVTIAVLVGTSFVPNQAVGVWMVTAPAGILAFSFEVVSDLISPRRQEDVVEKEDVDPAAEVTNVTRKSSTTDCESSGPEKQQQQQQLDQKSEADNQTPDKPQLSTAAATAAATATATEKLHPPSDPNDTDHKTLLSLLHSITKRLPRCSRTLGLLPIPLLPFAMAEFVLIRSLSQRGWITVFAHGFSHATPNPVAATFFFGFVSAAFLCPFFGTNIGATILLVEVLRDDAFTTGKTDQVVKGAVYAVAMGSNLGAFSYVFAGSLAGLLWRKLLADKGVVVARWRFCWINLVPLLVSTLLACAVVVGEVYWFA